MEWSFFNQTGPIEKSGPHFVFSKLFWLDRTDPLSFGLKFPESLVEWIMPQYSMCHYRPNLTSLSPISITSELTQHVQIGKK